MCLNPVFVCHEISMCSDMSLFVCITRVHKQYLLVRMPRKWPTWWWPCQHKVPTFYTDAHAVHTCLWCHLCEQFRALLSSVEEWSSWWSSDSQTWCISLPSDPVTPTTPLRKHSTHWLCNTASHRRLVWEDMVWGLKMWADHGSFKYADLLLCD